MSGSEHPPETRPFDRQDGQGRISITWTRAEHSVRVHAELENGRTFMAEDSAFDLALESLIAKLPPGTAPKMCATCALAFLDFFSAPDGFDDWSCFRERPDLAAELRSRGKHAGVEAFDHMHKVRVRATDICEDHLVRN